MKLPLNRSSQPAYAPNWHPNFRNTQLLPDLKVVRTTFFINASCIAMAAAALMFTGYREYQAYEFRSRMSEARQRMQEMGEENEKLLNLNKEFMAGLRKFEEAEQFAASRISPTRLLTSIAGVVPELFELSEISYGKTQLVLKGTIKLDSETASQRASAFLDTLRGDPFLGTTFTEISLTNLQRDNSSQGMSFEILLKQADPNAGRKPARIAK